MAKPTLRLKSRQLRKRGMSVKAIAKKLQVSPSTASLWTRDITLTLEQEKALKQASLKGAQRGRIKSALKQKRQRLERIEINKSKALKKIGHLTQRELLLVGISLYWAEGIKKSRKVSFCNSDPNLINLLIKWLKICFNINPNRLRAYVGINQAHRSREAEVIKYWPQQTGIPKKHFRKTSFKKVKNKKSYANKNEHFGTLTVYLLKPTTIYYEIMGYISVMHTAV